MDADGFEPSTLSNGFGKIYFQKSSLFSQLVSIKEKVNRFENLFYGLVQIFRVEFQKKYKTTEFLTSGLPVNSPLPST